MSISSCLSIISLNDFFCNLNVDFEKLCLSKPSIYDFFFCSCYVKFVKKTLFIYPGFYDFFVVVMLNLKNFDKDLDGVTNTNQLEIKINDSSINIP